MVIDFLDVNAKPVDFSDPASRADVERFAEEEIGGAAGEEFKRMMFKPLPAGDPEAERKSRVSSFSEVSAVQAQAIYRWLRYIEPFYKRESRLMASISSAAGYWRARSEAKR